MLWLNISAQHAHHDHETILLNCNIIFTHSVDCSHIFMGRDVIEDSHSTLHACILCNFLAQHADRDSFGAHAATDVIEL